MSFDMGNADRIAGFRRELLREGIALLPPVVNRSGVAFAVEDGAVRYALAALKNVGAAAMESLVGERAQNGPFRDVGDLADRLGAGVVNKRQMEHLIKAGALDSLNPNRRQLFECVDTIARLAAVAADDRSSNQVSLFGDDPAAAGAALRLPDVPDWPLTDRLRHEFEAVGVYLSAHPLDSYAKTLEKLNVVSYAQLMAQAGIPPTGAKLAGTVIGRKERRNAKGNKFAFVQLSDSSGLYEVTVFSETLAESRDLLDAAAATNTPVLVNVDVRIEDGDSVRLLVRSFSTLDFGGGALDQGFPDFPRRRRRHRPAPRLAYKGAGRARHGRSGGPLRRQRSRDPAQDQGSGPCRRCIRRSSRSPESFTSKKCKRSRRCRAGNSDSPLFDAAGAVPT